MHTKLLCSIAFYGLLNVVNIKTCETNLSLSLSGTPENLSPTNSPRNTTLNKLLDCNNKAHAIIRVMREKKEEDDDISKLIPHTNPLSSQSGRISNSSHKDKIRDKKINTGRFTTTPRSDLICVTSKHGESFGDLRLGYKFTHFTSAHIDNPDDDETKEITFQISKENKDHVINATHIEVKTYDEHGTPHEYVIDLNKPKHQNKSIEQYDAEIVALIPSAKVDQDQLMVSYKKDDITNYIYVTLKNILDNETITHKTKDGQKNILRLPENFREQIYKLYQEVWEKKEKELAKLAADVPSPSPSDSDSDTEPSSAKTPNEDQQENKSRRGIFFREQILNVSCYQGISICSNHDGHDYIYTLTYENEKISTAQINSSKELQTMHKYILVMNSNAGNDSFMIALPQAKEEQTQLTTTNIVELPQQKDEQIKSTSTINPDDAREFKKYNSYIKPIKVALGMSAFAAMIIAILYKYDQLPQAFIDALNKVGIVHAQ